MTSVFSSRQQSRLQYLFPLLFLFCIVDLGFIPTVTFAFQDKGEEESETDDETSEDEEDRIPKISEMKLPTVKELLQNPPVDWVVLKNNDVIVVEPITPRPDTLKKLEIELTELRKKPRPQSEEGREERKEEIQALNSLEIILVDGGEEPEFSIKTKDIQQIIYHEDLLLRRINKLLDEGTYRTAHEMFFNLVRELPDWPGIKKIQQKLLFLEAEDRLDLNEPQGALAYYEDLHQLNPKYPQLLIRLGEVNNTLIKKAMKKNDLRQARYFLDRLQQLEPKHTVAVKWVSYFQGESAKYLNQALAAEKNKEYPQAAENSKQAMDYWPKTRGVREAYRKLNRRFQRIRVGVLHLHNHNTPYFLPTASQLRHERLTTAMLFELNHNDETAHYRSSLFDQWEPTDLGRRATFKLKQKLAPWESRPVMTASDVVSTLDDYINPKSPRYDEQLSSYVKSLKVLSPFEFQVQFSRVPYRIEPLFIKPITTDEPATDEVKTDEQQDGEKRTPLKNKRRLLSQRFRVVKQGDDHVIYRRSVPEQDGLRTYHVAQITEVKQANHEQALQSLFRGEVVMLPTIQPWIVDRLKEFNQFAVKKYSLPATHVIQINPRSKVLKNHELRRALAYSLNRKKLLSEVVLQDPNMKYGRIVSAPYSKGNYAYHNLMKPRPYDLALGFTLSMLVKKQKAKLKKKVPTLKMLVPPDPIVQKVAAKIVERWNLIGIPVEIVNDPKFKTDANSHEWDIIYRKVRMAEPASDLWPFLTVRKHADVNSLRHLPDWLRQELVDLNTVTNFDDILSGLHRLHKDLQTEAYVLPLWEVDEFFVMRKNISGLPEHPVSLYQDVEQWIQLP